MTLPLDTTLLIDVLRDRPGRRNLLAGLVGRQDGLATSVIDAGEVYAGMRASEQRAVERLVRALDVLDLTGAVARRTGLLKNAWVSNGITLSLTDTMVAATALEHDLILMTDHRKDFPMPELRFFDLPEPDAMV